MAEQLVSVQQLYAKLLEMRDAEAAAAAEELAARAEEHASAALEASKGLWRALRTRQATPPSPALSGEVMEAPWVWLDQAALAVWA